MGLRHAPYGAIDFAWDSEKANVKFLFVARREHIRISRFEIWARAAFTSQVFEYWKIDIDDIALFSGLN